APLQVFPTTGLPYPENVVTTQAAGTVAKKGVRAGSLVLLVNTGAVAAFVIVKPDGMVAVIRGNVPIFTVPPVTVTGTGFFGVFTTVTVSATAVADANANTAATEADVRLGRPIVPCLRSFDSSQGTISCPSEGGSRLGTETLAVRCSRPSQRRRRT